MAAMLVNQLGKDAHERQCVMSAVIDELRKSAEARKQAAKRKLSAAAKKIASGKDVPIVELEQALEAAGHTADDLAKEVERARERMAAIEELANIRKLRLEVPGIEKQDAEARSVYEAAGAVYQKVHEPLAARLAYIRDQEAKQSSLEQLLRRTMDPDMQAQLDELGQQERDLMQNPTPLDGFGQFTALELQMMISPEARRVVEADVLLAKDGVGIDSPGAGMVSAETLKERADSGQRRIKAAEKRFGELEAQQKRLHARRDELLQKSLE